jgi:hypothetical protein
MHIGELVYRIAEHGVSLRCGQKVDWLHYAPAGVLPPEPMEEVKERNQEVIRILRENEQLQLTGPIRSKSRALGMARDYFEKGGGA